jgi:CheY-like chemotaxis protein
MLAESDAPLELRKVAERVGKSRTAPYLVFGKTEEGGGLEALRVAVAAEGFAELMDALRTARVSAARSDVALREVARAYLGFALAHPSLFRLIFGAEVARALASFRARPTTRPEVHQLMRARIEADELIQGLVASCQQVGAIGPGDVRMLAAGFWATLRGTALVLLDGQLAPAGERARPDDPAAVVMSLTIQDGKSGGATRSAPAEEDPAEFAAAAQAFAQAQFSRGHDPRTLDTSGLRRARHARRVLEGSRVLWIDDRPERLAAEQRTLEALGASVARARDTLEVLERLHELQAGATPGSFDVILSDIARHDSASAGTDELPLLKRAAPGTPVIFYVNRLTAGAERPAGSVGITDDPGELLHLILDVLERKRS